MESKIDAAKEEGKQRAGFGGVADDAKRDNESITVLKKAEVEGQKQQADLEKERQQEHGKGEKGDTGRASDNNNDNNNNDDDNDDNDNNNNNGDDKSNVNNGRGEEVKKGERNSESDSDDTDSESPLDHSSFLSFEEWRSQNLAKIGQLSMEQKHRRRQQQRHREQQHHQQQQQQHKRRQPTDPYDEAFGGEGEIDLGFAGFTTDSDASPVELSVEKIRASNIGRAKASNGPSERAGDDGTAADPSTGKPTTAVGGEGASPDDALWTPPRQNAGITRKERFNYASFDCAATVLKTNPQCAGASAILAESKEMYMLNECRAPSKFIVLELCEDILVDTIALANYEFFSSIFRTFRVSVADRYPPKPGQWKELGTYEALNTRDIQAFPVQNPLIWTRYLKIEFLSHYGNEFYCPLSLVRVHGTTMMEEYKAEGEAARVEEEEEEKAAAEMAEQGAEAEPNVDIEVPRERAEDQGQSWNVTMKEEQKNGDRDRDRVVEGINAAVSTAKDKCQVIVFEVERRLLSLPLLNEDGLCRVDENHAPVSIEKASPAASENEKGSRYEGKMETGSSTISGAHDFETNITQSQPTDPVSGHQEKISDSSTSPLSISIDKQATGAETMSNETNVPKTSIATNKTSASSSITTTVKTEKTSHAAKESASMSSCTPPNNSRQSQQPQQQATTTTSSSSLFPQAVPTIPPPPPPNPTTQESFFKSVNKRLHMLETNSTLSLLYIEEQSRLLRDAFLKMEKRQLNKTSSFLSNLNRTVLAELHEFRQQYDQVWQSVITEFEQQHTKYHREMFTVSRQLGLLADEVMFQKRLFFVQSVFILMLSFTVLFSKFLSGTGGSSHSARGYFDFPRAIFGSISGAGGHGSRTGSERNSEEQQPQQQFDHHQHHHQHNNNSNNNHHRHHHKPDNSSLGDGVASGVNTPSYPSPSASPEMSPLNTTFPTPQSASRSPLSTAFASAAATFRFKSLFTTTSPQSENGSTPITTMSGSEDSRHSRNPSSDTFSPS